MKILGIETSCDETAAAIVEDGQKLLSNSVASSLSLHIQYGGVVPEVAARSHLEVMTTVIKEALKSAKCSWADIDGIAVTYGGGLSGSLLIGVLTARSLAITKGKPLFAVNHAEAHVYANFITSSALIDYTPVPSAPKFPMLAGIVSGGHSHLVLFEDHFNYRLLGQTQDDAIGEAFDKVAKMLGLPYPGGPSIAQLALNGNPQCFKLPKPKMSGYDLSFSGLKTAVLRLAQAQIGESYDFPSIKLPERLSAPQKANIAASFQKVAIENIVDKLKTAYEGFLPASVVVAGGVASSSELRRQLSQALPLPIAYPDPKLCTDNGAMVAALGGFKASLGQSPADPYTLDITPDLSL